MNDEIYKRNLAIEQKYNIKISTIETSAFEGTVEKAVLSNTYDFDVANPPTAKALKSGSMGYYHDLNDVPVLDFSKPWWRTSVMKDTSIAGVNYFVVVTGRSGTEKYAATKYAVLTPVKATTLSLKNLTIKAKSTLVIWTKNGANQLTAADFNKFYGTSLVEGKDLVILDLMGLPDKYSIQIELQDNYSVISRVRLCHPRQRKQADPDRNGAYGG